MANLTTSERASPPVKSPPQHHAPGLAPLEYLQLTQRRGSITDPSLHASTHQSQPEHVQSPPRHPLANSFTNHRSSSYSFPPTKDQQDPPRPWSTPSTDSMDTDPVNSPPGRTSAGPDPARSCSKRKMSHDRQGYHYPDEAAAPPANPGGYPSFNPQEMEVPNPKRRGSTFDTNNRIAHLSLQDRRDSVDSRSSLSGISMGGWAGDRRDSVYSTTSIASSATSTGDSEPHPTPRPFAFPADPVGQNSQSSQSQPSHNYTMPPAPPIPSVHYSASAAAARRLSIPESSLPLNGIKPRARASRTARAVSGSDDSTRSSEGTAPANSSPLAQHAIPSASNAAPGSDPMNPNYLGPPGSKKETPYSRSPELRVSHKMAERKRRKEMKDLFDELRDQLPADRGMKASKWEILSKAVDYISQLKVAYTDMAGEIDRLRTEVNSLRGPNAPPQPPYQPHAIVVSAHHPPGTNRPNSGDHASTSPEATSRPSLGQNGNHHHGSNGHSGSDSSDKEMDRSPSVPTLHPLQPQTTGSQHQSPFATPTPQVQPQPLPQ
ncbi:hypothetical protein FRC04_008915 [Tulasnella sp. 424]|nr:hypothetical protein FRC04_008915 [Tulasnella sp. 424]KAG8973814.1 hypothetical protein FRC05_008233 [Tulasnella sp. 425]